MSFRIIPKKTITFLRKNNRRKEKDSLLANHFHKNTHKKPERASVFTSKGSITVESALVLPLFFFAILCLVYLLEMMAIQTTIRNALYSTGKEVAKQAYLSPIISTNAIEKKIVQTIGEKSLSKSMVVGGVEGLDCGKSSSDWETGVIDLSVSYKLEVPVLMFRIPLISKTEKLKVKGWTGEVKDTSGNEQAEVVYITEHGTVYHEDLHCTYLEVALRVIRESELESKRNQSGGKYYPCESCGGGASAGRYYITDYGDRYHVSLECKKIKRNIYAVPKEEVSQRGGCSKCVR